MNKHPRSAETGASPELAVVHAPATEAVPSTPPGVVSTADFAARVGEQFLLAEELRRDGGARAQAEEQRLVDMLRELRRRAPRGRPSFPQVPQALAAHADILGTLRHDAQARGLSRLHPRLRQFAHSFQVELLRPQQTFNQHWCGVLHEAHTQLAVSRHGDVAAWIRQTLQPLVDPTRWRLATHRAGLSARAARLSKRTGLEALRWRLRPVLERMRQWNQQALDVLCAAHGKVLPTRAEAERMMARLAQLEDPLPPGVPVPVPEPVRAVLTAQRDFARLAFQALERELALTPAVGEEEYRQWCRAHEPARIAEATRQVRALERPASFSVVVSAHDADVAHWRACVESVLAQTHDAWELCVAGPEPVLTRLRAQLSEASLQDGRLRFLPCSDTLGRAGQLNVALAAARADAVAFLDAGDQLAPHALAELALALHAHPAAPLFYTDEDRLEAGGQRRRPFFKPAWSLDMHRESTYAVRLLVARRQLCADLRGLDEAAAGAELMDFVLRAAETQVPIQHVPAVLYHRREGARAFQVVNAASHAALSRHLSRSGEDAEVWTAGDQLRVRHRVQGTPRVSIIVPFKDKPELLAQLWNSFRAKTGRWEHWQLILVSNNSVDPRTFQLLDTLEDPRVLKLTWNHPFNYSAINNFAARHADGELFLFLNNDIELVDEGWMEELIAQAQRPDVGLVGPLLLFPNGLVQHAGVVLGPGGFASHPFWRYRPDEPWTPFGSINHARDYLAVTSACVMVRRDVFEAVGGYDERFRVSGSDVELGLRIIQRGLRCLFTPHTRMIHHESATRRLDAIPDRDAWLSYAAFRPWSRQGDPFYNVHLTLSAMNCGLRTDERPMDALAVQMLAWELPATLGMIGPG